MYYVLLCYDHRTFSSAKYAFVEVSQAGEQLLSDIAAKAKELLCTQINLPVEEVCVHRYQVINDMPMIIQSK